MKSDNFQSAWEKFKAQNDTDRIFEKEILDIIEVHNKTSIFSATDRIIRNAAIFSFIIVFCQNCSI